MSDDINFYSNEVHHGDVSICGEANVYGDMNAFGGACVCGDMTVCGDMCVCRNMNVCGNMCVSGCMNISEKALVCGDIGVCGDMCVCGEARVYGDMSVCGMTVYEDINVCGDINISGEARVESMWVCESMEVCGDVGIYGDLTLSTGRDVVCVDYTQNHVYFCLNNKLLDSVRISGCDSTGRHCEYYPVYSERTIYDCSYSGCRVRSIVALSCSAYSCITTQNCVVSDTLYFVYPD